MIKTGQEYNHPIWGRYYIPDKDPLIKSIGDLTLWIIQKENEIQIAYTNKPVDANKINTIPDDAYWQRWAFRTEKPIIDIKPVFPDRPVIVKPEAAFRVAEDASVRIFVRVPVWISVVLIGKSPTTLVELPTVSLSNTWFGTFAEGELCYWISSGARKVIDEDPDRPYLAISPLLMVDNSPEDLNVEKICHRVSHLSLFIQNGQLWSDETKVVYKGLTEVSQIEVAGKAPNEAKNGVLISRPREVMKKTFNAKTFSSFKELPGMGLFIR